MTTTPHPSPAHPPTRLAIPVRPVTVVPAPTWDVDEALRRAVYAAADRLTDPGLANRVRAAEDSLVQAEELDATVEEILTAGIVRATKLLTVGMRYAADAVLWYETRRAESLLGEGGAR